jgi:hypothetical protein
MTARTRKVVINLSALVTAIAGAVAWAAPHAGKIVDERYVHADSFRLVRLRDSLTYQSEIRDIHRLLFHLDSDVHSPRRTR